MRSPLDRVIAAITDFNNPFYAEERQRDVANEAAAFGYWLLVWTLILGAGAVCWFLPGYHNAAATVALWVLAISGLTSLYARRLGVSLTPRNRSETFPRKLMTGLAGSWLGLGWARATFGIIGDDTFPWMFLGLYAIWLFVFMKLLKRPNRPTHQGPSSS